MASAILFSVLFGTALATSYPSSNSTSSASYPHIPSGTCTDYTITVPITSTNLIWAAPPFTSNFDVVDWLFNTSRKDSQEVWMPFAGSENVTKDYTISATFCTPKETNGKEGTVLLATSGLGYDSRYWAPSYKGEEYSFAEHALKAGYSIFFYDRIGTGKSQKESGYIAQPSQAIALLTHLAQSVKAGQYTSSITAIKLVLVGHSFGSFSSNAAVALDPSLADGVVLTGIAYPNASVDLGGAASSGWGPTAFSARIASTVNPNLWPSFIYDTGYVTFGDIYSHVDTFFRTYEVDVAEYANTIAQPLAVTELSALATIALDAGNYTGKVFVSTGEFDLLLCGGECTSTYETGLQEVIWRGASTLETYLQPGSGHGVNFNKNASGFFGEIVGFLDRNF